MLNEEEFLFGARKPLFLDECQIHFLSKASRETGTFWIFVFLYRNWLRFVFHVHVIDFEE